jgi:hypothetical protein
MHELMALIKELEQKAKLHLLVLKWIRETDLEEWIKK